MRWWTIAGGVLAVAAAAAGTGAFVTGRDPAGAAEEQPVERTLVPVERRGLSREEAFDGTTGYGDPRPLVLAANGTLTALPEPGTVVVPGTVIAEVDGQPIVALHGALPMWRDLGPSVDDGRDVLQLEYALAALGFAAPYGMTVDGHWTAATTRAVKDFQEAHGQEDDGIVHLGELVWVDGEVRVHSVGGTLGQSAGEAAIEVTDATPGVHLDVDVDDVDLLAAGTLVEIELPSGERAPGRVTAVGTAETAQDGSVSVPVEITPDDPTALAVGTPVDVVVTTVAAEDVLAVPVEAVLALAEGGYALEVADETGATHLVRVELGVFADGMVEVRGDLTPGDQVVTA